MQCIHMQIHIHVYVQYMYMYMYMHVLVCFHVYTCVSVFVHSCINSDQVFTTTNSPMTVPYINMAFMLDTIIVLET